MDFSTDPATRHRNRDSIGGCNKQMPISNLEEMFCNIDECNHGYAHRECKEAQTRTLTVCTRFSYLSSVETHVIRTYLTSARALRSYGVGGVVLGPKVPLGATRSDDQAA